MSTEAGVPGVLNVIGVFRPTLAKRRSLFHVVCHYRIHMVSSRGSTKTKGEISSVAYQIPDTLRCNRQDVGEQGANNKRASHCERARESSGTFSKRISVLYHSVASDFISEKGPFVVTGGRKAGVSPRR